MGSWSQDKYLKAINYAAERHGDQKVPGSTKPYMTHLASVAMEVISALAHESVEDPDLAVQCALLHDTIEDAGVSYQELEDRFGTAVADGVLALTKTNTLKTKAEKMAHPV
jgi:(p)ppGpp synthase/HD superfamily hydrolase